MTPIVQFLSEDYHDGGGAAPRANSSRDSGLRAPQGPDNDDVRPHVVEPAAGPLPVAAAQAGCLGPRRPNNGRQRGVLLVAGARFRRRPRLVRGGRRERRRKLGW